MPPATTRLRARHAAARFYVSRAPHLLRSLSLALAFCSPVAVIAAPATLPTKPNVSFIYDDDLGYGDLGCYGAKDIETPHIYPLAAEGTRFTSFYLAQSVCTAARAALMTGSYANRVSMSGALNHTSTVGLHTREKLLGQVFKDQGYATAAFGKWHLGHHPQFLPTRRGFDEWLGIPYPNDNGPFLSYGEHAGLSGPLREGKRTTSEGGMRTPCLVRWPGRVPAARVSDEPFSTMDFHVTLA